MIGFVACRVTSKVLGVVASERYFSAVNTIIYVKNILSTVMYQINRLLFIHMHVLNQLESKI